MELMAAIRTRRSIRRFESKAIPDEAANDLKQAVACAPSAGNLQSRFFYFVSDKKKIAEVCEATMRQYGPEMPLVVVACADYDAARHYGERGKEIYCVMDVAASVENLLLAAHAHGLGAVWCSAFDEQAVRKALDIPQHLRPLVVVPVGYPKEKPGTRKTRQLNELIKEA